MVCKNCGKENSVLLDNCFYCGKKLNKYKGIKANKNKNKKNSTFYILFIIVLGLVIVALSFIISLLGFDLYKKLINCASSSDFSNDMCNANANFWGFLIVVPTTFIISTLTLFCIIKRILNRFF